MWSGNSLESHIQEAWQKRTRSIKRDDTLVDRDDSVPLRVDEFQEWIYFFLYHPHSPLLFLSDLFEQTIGR